MYDTTVLTGIIWLTTEANGGACEQHNRRFIYQLSD
jgi:hypothetical protein